MSRDQPEGSSEKCEAENGPARTIFGLRAGPLLMLGAALSFTIMVSAVKVARAELSTLEVVAWRGLVSVPLAALVVPRGRWGIQNRGWMGLRVGFGFLAMFCYFTAAGGLPIADLTLIGRLQPIVLAGVAPLLLGAGERASRRVWTLSLLGVAGCGLLLGPSLAVGNIAGIWALGAVAASSISHLSLRRLGATEDSRTVAFWFQVAVSGLALLVLVLGGHGLPELPDAALLPWLVLVGIGAMLGQNLLSRAYQLERAAPVAAASHASPVFGVLIDLLLFATIPGPAVIFGGALVMAAALGLVWSKER
jgi:drug/metabolite transporter (DMT)-like permease